MRESLLLGRWWLWQTPSYENWVFSSLSYVELTLSYWKARNYSRMAQYLPSMFGGSVKKIAGQVREIYSSKPLENFEFQEIKDEASAITNIEVKLWYEEDGIPVERVVVVRLLSEDTKGNPVVRGKPNSVWRIVTWGLV